LRVVYEFDPFELAGVDGPDKKSSTREALEEIAEFVKTEIIIHAGEGRSPVSGGAWKRSLSPEYRKLKEKISGVSFANMELHGDLLDALEARVVGNRIQVGWFSGLEAQKADGHNNFSGKSQLPLRQTIPKEGETFRRDIISGMKQIAEAFMEED
jgi:uncharacterized protein YgfB (UPF0149 family)